MASSTHGSLSRADEAGVKGIVNMLKENNFPMVCTVHLHTDRKHIPMERVQCWVQIRRSTAIVSNMHQSRFTKRAGQ